MAKIDNIIAIPTQHDDLNYRARPYLCIYYKDDLEPLNALTIIMMNMEISVIREVIETFGNYEYGDNIAMKFICLYDKTGLEILTDLGGTNGETLTEFVTMHQLNSLLDIVGGEIDVGREYIIGIDGVVSIQSTS